MAGTTSHLHEGRQKFYDRRSARLCTYCETLVMWMFTRFDDKRLPFDAELLPKDWDVNEEGWLPGMWDVRGRQRMVMAPVTHYGRMKRGRVTHVAVVHHCPKWIAAQAEREREALVGA